MNTATTNMAMEYFDIEQLDASSIYKLLASTIVPRPIALTVTKSANGALNAAPFSLFNFFSGVPPIICLGMGDHASRLKDSYSNILETGDFVVSLVNAELLPAMNVTAVAFPADVSEIEEANLPLTPCRKVDVPRIATSPVSLECRKWKTIDLDHRNHLLIAHVLAVHVTTAAVENAEKCYIDGSALHLLGRMQSPGWYTHTEDRFHLRTPTFQEWVDQDHHLTEGVGPSLGKAFGS